MPTSTKRATPVTRKVAPKKAVAPVSKAKAVAPASKPKAVAPVSKPFMRFHHSHELRVKTLEVLEAVETAEKATVYSGELTELVLELTDNGMDQYFLQPLRATKANFVVQQTAAMGMAGVQKVMGSVVRNIFGRMDDRQLLSVCGSIRQFMA